MNYQRILVILLLLTARRLSAQTQLSGWLADFNTVKISTKLSLHSDIQLRSTDNLEHVQTSLLRAGLNYRTGRLITLTGGYAYIRNRRTIEGVSGYAPEHRIWEQFLLTHPLTIGKGAQARKGTLAHRFRLEQRFIAKSQLLNHEWLNEGNIYANRLRYFIRNVTPLIPWSAKGQAPFLALQNEVFVHFGDKSGVNGEFFDQNRAYIALGYRFHKSFDAEIGYMNQYVNGRGSTFVNNHIVQLATYVRL